MSTVVVAVLGALAAVFAGWVLERRRLGPEPAPAAPADGAVDGRPAPEADDPDEILGHLERTVRELDGGGSVAVVLFQLEGYGELEAGGRSGARRYLSDVLRAVRDRLEEGQQLGALDEPAGRLLAVLPEATSAAASLFAERARMNLAPVEPEEGPPCPLSAGVAAMSAAGTDPEDVLDEAERALEQALRLGGDRVMVFRQGVFREGPLKGASTSSR